MQKPNGDLSVAGMVLVSTAIAADWTTNPVPYPEIVIQAWRAFPHQFSLPSHPEYPDASDVHKPLYRTLKAVELIEVTGNKRFRVTEQGLSTARQMVAEMPQALPTRKVIVVEIDDDATTQAAIQAVMDAAGPVAERIAERLLASAFSVRFPSKRELASINEKGGREQLDIGDTTFSVLIPASLEALQSWIGTGASGSRRRLVVRDPVVATAQKVIDTASATNWVAYGIESFLGQLIDGMAEFDGPRSMAVLRSLIEAYNQALPNELPQILLKAPAGLAIEGA